MKPERDVQLRPAAISDRGFAFHAWKTAMKEYVEATWGWDEAAQVERQRAEFDELFDPHYQIIEVTGHPAGTLIVNRHPDHLYLSGLYLLPHYQRQGYGSQILRGLLSEAQSQNIPIRLRVLRVNQQAHYLYERLGFSAIDESELPFTVMEANCGGVDADGLERV